MNSKAKLCDKCNSEIITVKRDNRFVAECSYCGLPQEKGFYIEEFIPEMEDES